METLNQRNSKSTGRPNNCAVGVLSAGTPAPVTFNFNVKGS